MSILTLIAKLVAQGAGTVDVITANFDGAIPANSAAKIWVRSTGPSTIVGVTIQPDGWGAKSIKARGNQALLIGDTGPSGYMMSLQFNIAGDYFELINPARKADLTTDGKVSVAQSRTIAQLLAADGKTGGNALSSDNGAAQAILNDTAARMIWDYNDYTEVKLDDDGINLIGSNVKKNGFQIATENYADTKVASVTGTSNRITSTGGATPVIDIASTYAGQASITTVGTIGTGVWQGTAIADAYISSASTWNAKATTTYVDTSIATEVTNRNSAIASAIATEVIDRNTAISAATVGLLDDRGNFNASGNLFPSSGGSGTAGAILKGDLWTISVAGTLGGHAVTAGDVVRCLTDTPGQTDSNWAIGENNFGYTALNAAIADGKIYIGNVSGVGTAVTLTGDVTVSNAGVTAIGASKVTNAMLAGSIDLTTKVTGILPPANGGTGVANNAASTWAVSGNFGTTVTVTATTAVTLPTSGTLYGTKAGSITSAQMLLSMSDPTGTGASVFGTSPTFVTQIQTPLVQGGTGAASQLDLRGTNNASVTTTAIAVEQWIGNGGTTSGVRLYQDNQFLIGAPSGTLVRIPGGLALVRIGHGTSTIDFGEKSSGLAAIYLSQATPSVTNHAVAGSGGTTQFNATTTAQLTVSAVAKISATSTVTTHSNSTLLVAGTTTLYPLRFVSGTNLTTAVVGTHEYNGTNWTFTRTGTTRETVLSGIQSTLNALGLTALTQLVNQIKVNIGGNDYYIPCSAANTALT